MPVSRDPVSRDQFDTDLAAAQAATNDLVAADTDYIAAVDAFIALPPVVDLAAEDATVQAGLATLATAKQAVVDAKSRIPTPP